MRILSTEQMREADRRTIEDIGIPSLVLMENAGRQVVSAMESAFQDLSERRVAVISGKGSNGGDGFVVARTLLQRGIDVSVFVVGQLGEIRGDARLNLEILGRLGATVVEITDEGQWDLHFSEISDHDLIVDALFGTGLRSALSGIYETIVADINAADIPVVAIDLPSGMSADSNDLIGDCIEATMTITLGAPKLPLILPPAEAKAGEVVIADIGIPAAIIEALEGPRVELLTRQQIRTLVNARAADVHKGDFGRVLVVAGSQGKSGAAILAALGALKAGAGLVTVAVPRSVAAIVAGYAPEYMTEALQETESGTVTSLATEQALAVSADVIALGPGLGGGHEVSAFVRNVLEKAETPCVLDADALNVFGGDSGALVGREGRDVIITPHPGEMARLVGCTVDDVQADRVGIARDFAASHRLYVVLKGYRSLVATPDGKLFINPTGSPGMATGGTGDVLTGILAATLAQLLDAEAACRLAVYLHGAAGELADADQGEVAMTAMDLVDHISDAILELTARRRVVQKEE
jgi:ADP-dependent NAD(P)H-hydrate dehydratase / NAD(P)H-hydrate epimerase